MKNIATLSIIVSALVLAGCPGSKPNTDSNPTGEGKNQPNPNSTLAPAMWNLQSQIEGYEFDLYAFNSPKSCNRWSFGFPTIETTHHEIDVRLNFQEIEGKTVGFLVYSAQVSPKSISSAEIEKYTDLLKKDISQQLKNKNWPGIENCQFSPEKLEITESDYHYTEKNNTSSFLTTLNATLELQFLDPLVGKFQEPLSTSSVFDFSFKTDITSPDAEVKQIENHIASLGSVEIGSIKVEDRQIRDELGNTRTIPVILTSKDQFIYSGLMETRFNHPSVVCARQQYEDQKAKNLDFFNKHGLVPFSEECLNTN